MIKSNNGTFGLDRLRHFFRRYGATVCEDFGRCLALVEPRDFAAEIREKFVAERHKMIDTVRGMIAEGINDGSIRPCDPQALTMAMLDAFDALARWFDSSGPTPLGMVIDQYLSIFLTDVIAIIGPDPGRLAAQAQERTRASQRVQQSRGFNPPTRRDEPLFVVRLRG